MRTTLTIVILLLFGYGLKGQVQLEVIGEAKISVMRSTTTTDVNVVRLSNGNLAIRQYQIGDFAQGGIVFWVDESGEHGLVCAKNDQSSNIRWHAGFLGSVQAKGDGPFSGEMNTIIIIAGLNHYGDDGNSHAARICAELKVTEGGKTYGDWYLPSKEELELIYLNKNDINNAAVQHNGGITQEDLYWSSTEDDLDSAWLHDFRTNGTTAGQPVLGGKASLYRVRAVRAF